MITSVIEYLFLLIAHAVAGIYSSALKFSKKITWSIWGVWIGVQCGLLIYAEHGLSDHGLRFFSGFILPLLGQYVIFFVTTRGRVFQRIFTLLTYSIFFCISMTVFLLIKGSFGELPPIVMVCFHGVILLGIVSYFLRFVCPLCRAAEKNVTTGWLPLIFLNVVIIITVILSSVFPVRLNHFSDPGAATFIFVSISIMAVYPIVFSNINSLSEAAMKREVEMQNRMLLAQIEAENVQLAAARQARHDRRHHTMVMLELANNHDIESLKAYLGNLVESDSAPGVEASYCENITVNTVLKVYERRARKSGIPVNITAQASREMAISPQDLVIVIANLFENAICAAENVKEQGRNIDILIRESAQRLLIRIENPCRSNLVFDESMYGIGICSVIASINKYEGMYDFTAENGVFSAKISINLK